MGEQQEISPRVVAYVLREAGRAWQQLAASDEATPIGDEGVDPTVAVVAQGWPILGTGAVVLARRGRGLVAVGTHRGRPVAVPVALGDSEDGA